MFGAAVAVKDKKIYITSDASPVDYARHQVYVYDVHTDHWDQLPPPGQYKGIPYIIGGKLAIIGGRLPATMNRTNRVSTFNEASQTWTSYYPDLLSIRSKPGVVTHLEHVIVAGGGTGDDSQVVQDDIEILNWIENSHWRKVSIKLPQPMYGFTPIISHDHLTIVGYSGADDLGYAGAYKMPVDDIIRSADQQKTSSKWIKLKAATHWRTALVPNFFPPVLVGGQDQMGTTPMSYIKMYDDSKKSWKNIASLSSARSAVAVAVLDDNAIIVLGGCTKGNDLSNAMSSCLTTVELGQAQLL